jgi:bacteriophage N4 adsorption protein B
MELTVVVMSWLFGVVAVYFLISSLDNLVVEALSLAWRFIYRHRFMRSHQMLFQDALKKEDEQPIAILVPAWQEAGVIQEMLRYFVENVDYKNYIIFVGLYSNDLETHSAADQVRVEYPGKIRVVLLSQHGPTTKDDCLNCIMRSIFDYETQINQKFSIYVVEDAEDAVPRFGLRVFNHLIPSKDLVQLPVYPAPTRLRDLTAGTYLDEFAQMHLKELRVREWLTGTIPSSGVGVAMSRRAVEVALTINHGKVFPENTLTADYELPLQLVKKGIRTIFFDALIDPDRAHQSRHWAWSHHRMSPAIRSLFPESFKAAVRQKSRWILGIVFHGWEHLRWEGSWINRYFLWRDRKALFGHYMSILGYLLVFMVLALQLVEALGVGTINVVSHLLAQGNALWYLFYFNLWLMLIQIIIRIITTFELYGVAHGLMSVPRLIVLNIINFSATLRAVRLYMRHRRSGIGEILWDKTEGHRLP